LELRKQWSHQGAVTVRASTLLTPSQELAARAQPMSRPFLFLFLFSSPSHNGSPGLLLPAFQQEL
jgi:hypothetical protein